MRPPLQCPRHECPLHSARPAASAKVRAHLTRRESACTVTCSVRVLRTPHSPPCHSPHLSRPPSADTGCCCCCCYYCYYCAYTCTGCLHLHLLSPLLVAVVQVLFRLPHLKNDFPSYTAPGRDHLGRGIWNPSNAGPRLLLEPSPRLGPARPSRLRNPSPDVGCAALLSFFHQVPAAAARALTDPCARLPPSISSSLIQHLFLSHTPSRPFPYLLLPLPILPPEAQPCSTYSPISYREYSPRGAPCRPSDPVLVKALPHTSLWGKPPPIPDYSLTSRHCIVVPSHPSSSPSSPLTRPSRPPTPPS